MNHSKPSPPTPFPPAPNLPGEGRHRPPTTTLPSTTPPGWCAARKVRGGWERGLGGEGFALWIRRALSSFGVAAVLWTIVLWVVVLPGPLAAHHILGIPHYKYGDEYPQIPYMEVLAQVGPHDLVFTHFPGFPEPGEAVRLKLYVRDRTTGEVYREPLRTEVTRKHFFAGAEPVAEPLTIRTGDGPERNDYKFYLTFRAAEAYEVQVHFPTANGAEVIPFPVTIGKTDDRPLIFGAAGLLAAAVATVAAIKRRRRRTWASGRTLS